MRKAQGAGFYLEDVHGPQDDYFKHALVRQARRLDAVLAVGDWVVKGLRFVGPEFAARPIDLVYNGVSAVGMPSSEREQARHKLQQSGGQLLGGLRIWFLPRSPAW
jgi:hypothetical protein